MPTGLSLISLLVHDYNPAIDFFRTALRFDLLEDTPRGNGKRWVVMARPNSTGANLLLAKAVTPEQIAAVGNQTPGRVFLFLETPDFWSDYHHMLAHNVRFLESPREEPYATVAVFLDLSGNRWDLLQPKQN